MDSFVFSFIFFKLSRNYFRGGIRFTQPMYTKLVIISLIFAKKDEKLEFKTCLEVKLLTKTGR